VERQAQKQNGTNDLSQMMHSHWALTSEEVSDFECNRGLRQLPVFLRTARGMLTPVTGRGNGAQPKHDPLRVKLYQISVTV
jgi:hypothetical protein